MSDVILAGGPEHGRRLRMGDDVKEYVTVASLPPGAFLPAQVQPRPPWWHPVRRRRWRPPLPPAPPEFTQYSYRRDGQLSDGTPVYWLQDAKEPPAMTSEVITGGSVPAPPRAAGEAEGG